CDQSPAMRRRGRVTAGPRRIRRHSAEETRESYAPDDREDRHSPRHSRKCRQPARWPRDDTVSAARSAPPAFGPPEFSLPPFGRPVFGSPAFGSPAFGSPAFSERFSSAGGLPSFPDSFGPWLTISWVGCGASAFSPISPIL